MRYTIKTYALQLTTCGDPATPARPLRSSEETARLAREFYRDFDADQEHFCVILLNNKNRVNGIKMVASGSLTACLVHPATVYRYAILDGAAAIVLVHNHPSGEPRPSPEDIELTRRLKQVGEVHGIRVVDHVVIGDGTTAFYSFADAGMLGG